MAEIAQNVRALAFVCNSIRNAWRAADIERELNRDTRDFATLAIAAVRAAADVRVSSPAGIATVSGVIRSDHPTVAGTPVTETPQPGRLAKCDKCGWPTGDCHCNHDHDTNMAAYRAEIERIKAGTDPDCRNKKHGSCIGGPCLCPCHNRKETP